MIDGRLGDALEIIRKQVALQHAAALSDRALLEAFVRTKDGSAFGTLLHRHGAMVLTVCRRVLRRSHDAEDACQATFLILAQKAGTIRQRDSLAAWLHGVAFRVAQRLRRDLARRDRRAIAAEDVAQADTTDAVTWRDVKGVIDEELTRLGDNYRAPLVLCYLEGKTQDEAARQLGWTDAVLRGRLDRGRERLRKQLVRRGVSLSAALLGTALTESSAAAAFPVLLAVSTAKAAGMLAAGKAAAPCALSAQVVALMEGASRAMAMTKLKVATAVLVMASFIAAGIGTLAHSVWAAPVTSKEGSQLEQAALAGNQPRTHKERENDLKPKSDAELLMGSWTVIKRGDKVGFDRSITFTPDRLLLHFGPNTVFRCKYALDATKTPKVIDIHGAENGTGANPVDPYRCIYRLDGEDLELAIGTPTLRPTSFAEAAKEGRHVVLKREPAANEEKKFDKKKVTVGKNVDVEFEGKKAVRVLIQAHVCCRDGTLEQLLTRKRKKEHEAVLSADVDARDIHTALLLAGAAVGKPVQFAPKLVAPSGTRVKITLEYLAADGSTVRVPAQRWIRHIQSKKDLEHHWVFAGSGFALDPSDPTILRYRANDGDIICVANFEAALLDLPVVSSNENADLAFEAHTERIPPLETAVLVILEPMAGRK